MGFPQDFRWGVASASYQIEGTAHSAGGGHSVWDMFCRRPGAIANGDTGEVACDHYRRYQEDVMLMRELEIQDYRFSISWPRVLPRGVGALNAAGLDFYDRLVDSLLAANIRPWATLFHWDYPYELYCRGGWLSPESPDWFAEYTRVVVERLSDRVQHWITLNEPQCFIGLGHRDGKHAPGDQRHWPEVWRGAHHALLAHGKAVQAIRAYARRPAQVGLAPVGGAGVPLTEAPADVEATRRYMFEMTQETYWSNVWFLDPIFFGRYPEDGLRVVGTHAPEIRDGDMETIGQPLDFFGVNLYTAETIRAGADGAPVVVPQPPGVPRTTMEWAVTPAALYWGPRLYWERYGKPIVITENGMANVDWVGLDGKVHDPQRVDFLQRYLRELERAAGDGVDVRGYFHWSLMDNLEWAEGFGRRFGLIYVDYLSQQRILKDSAYWYREIIRTNGAALHEPELSGPSPLARA